MFPEKSLRPMIFSVFNSIPECASFELMGRAGVVLKSNCHIPLEGKVAFRQVQNAASLFDPSLRYGIEVEIREKAFEWMAVEMHVPRKELEGCLSVTLQVVARSSEPNTLSVGYGGVLDRGRGFDCFVFRDYKTSQQYKTITHEIEFGALPMDEIENEYFVVALYFNHTEPTTMTISEFRLDLNHGAG